LEREVAKLQNKYKTEFTQVERECENLKRKLEDIECANQTSNSRMRNMEIDNNNFER
jgi:Skp family chaperone for outer membrane proteins